MDVDGIQVQDCTEPQVVRRIRIIFVVLLALVVAIDFGYSMLVAHYAHGQFAKVTTIDAQSYLFYPLFSFFGCVLMVYGSKKIVAMMLSRTATYYDDQAPADDAQGDRT